MYRPIGRIRIRLAEMLTERLGFAVEPEDFWLQDPTHLRAQWDCAAWGADPRVDGCIRSICSFDSMTKCVRNGFSVIEGKGSSRAYGDIEICARSFKVASQLAC